jgi:Ca-activated chloride channel homolog
MYFTFANPRYLFFLLVIPFIVFIYLLSLKSAKKTALKFANFPAIARVKGVDFFSKNIITTILSSLIVFLLVLSAAGLTMHKQAYASSFSFVLAVDVSRSMEAKDLPPSRLEAAKETAKAFIDAAPQTTRIGVVSFSGNAFINQEVTENKEMVRDAIDSLDVSSIDGTDIYEVVITSTNILRGEEGGSIILLSDGQMNVGDAEETILYANDHNVIINTLAIGTKEGGQTIYGISKLDEDALKALAYNTGGTYYSASDKESLSEAMDSILKLSKRKVSIDLSVYLIIASIIFFTLEYFLANLRYKMLPF